ncbi:hypothetical protein SAMN02745975_03813 [Geosporobacter subterraneus DSM 17957]|uniref:DUF4829 domain-containing protein n=1 Tax=Geosporobacter subterraneus DSM 17957 TaxID=1121919 RepID=A0A1M6QBB5_9FIRM|nr:hypothetical protein [Geosporobacter subterraneus]SHK17584.1 hypothetical protein SAMN02745975_03813 [Geosporobacter subterraneus DSM 17957]
MKKFILIISSIILMVYIGLQTDVEKLYPGRDEKAPIYLKVAEDEAYYLKVRQQIQHVLDQYTASMLKKDTDKLMEQISEEYRDDQTRDYKLLEEGIENELKDLGYVHLDYQIQLIYPTAQGIWVRMEKKYGQTRDGQEIAKRLIEDFLFVQEKGSWKIRGIKTVSKLI